MSLFHSVKDVCHYVTISQCKTEANGGKMGKHVQKRVETHKKTGIMGWKQA